MKNGQCQVTRLTKYFNEDENILEKISENCYNNKMKNILETREIETRKVRDSDKLKLKNFLGKMKGRPSTKLIGFYSSSKTKSLFQCQVCLAEYMAVPAAVLARECCPKCSVNTYTFVTENGKIGITNNIVRRMKELKTKCLFYIESDSRQEAYLLEQKWLRGMKNGEKGNS